MKMFLLLSIVTFSMSALVQSEPVSNDINDANEYRISAVLECFQQKFSDKCLRVKAIGAAKLWSNSVVASARDNKDLYQEDPREVGNLAQEIGELITYGISRLFNSEEPETSGDPVANKTGKLDEEGKLLAGKSGVLCCRQSLSSLFLLWPFKIHFHSRDFELPLQLFSSCTIYLITFVNFKCH